MSRTDTYALVVANHVTGQRYSTTGTKAECEAAGKAKQKEWRGEKSEVIILKR